jgi:hypothetical protein
VRHEALSYGAAHRRALDLLDIRRLIEVSVEIA